MRHILIVAAIIIAGCTPATRGEVDGLAEDVHRLRGEVRELDQKLSDIQRERDAYLQSQDHLFLKPVSGSWRYQIGENGDVWITCDMNHSFGKRYWYDKDSTLYLLHNYGYAKIPLQISKYKVRADSARSIQQEEQ